MYKKDGVYWCKFTMPGEKPTYARLGKDKKSAKAIEAKLRAEVHEGKFFDKKKGQYLTVEEFLSLYEERHSKLHKCKQTVINESFLAIAIKKKLGSLFLREVTPAILEEYIENRRAEKKRDITIHHELNLLKHAFTLALKKWDLFDKNPFDKVKLPKGQKNRVRYLKPKEEKKLLKALEGKDWLRSIVIIARETGLRLSNICNLTWKQVDLASKSIEVEKTKNGKPVWIPMTKVVFKEFKVLSKIQNLTSNLVFVVDGKQLHRNWVGRRFRRLCKRIKLEGFRFHDLRHDFCSRLVQAGQQLQVVAELAGHEDIKTTQRYAHLSPDNKIQAIASLDR